MKRANRKRIGIISATLFTVVAFGLLAGSTYYALAQNQRYRDVRDRLIAIESQARRVDALEARWQSVSEEAKSIERAFVRRDQLSEFLEAVEETASSAGVNESTSIFEDTQDEIKLRLRVSGLFTNVYTFVTHLNVLPNLLFLERVDFSQGAAVIGIDAPTEVIANYSTAEVIVRIPLQITSE